MKLLPSEIYFNNLDLIRSDINMVEMTSSESQS